MLLFSVKDHKWLMNRLLFFSGFYMSKKDFNNFTMSLLGRLFDGFMLGLHIYEIQEDPKEDKQEGKKESQNKKPPAFYLQYSNTLAEKFFPIETEAKTKKTSIPKDFYDIFPFFQKFSLKEKIQAKKIQQFLFDRTPAKGGEKSYYNMRMFSMSSSPPLYLYVLFEDMTARFRAESLFTKYRGQMIYTSKMSLLGEMASGVSHEINNPLSVISCVAQLLYQKSQKDSVSSEELKEQTLKMRKMVDRMAKIVSNLRYFSQSPEGPLKYEKVTISVLVDRVTSLCLEKLKKGAIQFKTELPQGPVALFCDSLSLCQALFQLLSNAHDAVMEVENKWILLQVKCIGDQVHFIVRDSGHGIRKDIAHRIMEPFFTTKDYGQGSGLGLSMCLGVAKAHQGALLLGEQKNPTEFIFSIPIRSPKVAVTS